MEEMLTSKRIFLGILLICLFVENLEARHIKKWAKTKKDLHHTISHQNQIKSKRGEIAGDLEIDGNRFESIGCFRDAWNRVLPALEGEHQLLMEPNYKARKYALLKCARAAADKKLKLFGIENGGQCFGADDEKSLNKYGVAIECKGDGKGGPWSLQAYRFKDFPTDGAFTKWSAWTTCSKTCGHGVRRRMRTCSNPPPSNGGKDCSELGPSVEGEICKDKDCPRSTLLVDEAESGNSNQPTLSTTPRNTAVPAAATYRPTISPLKTQKSKQNLKVSDNKNEEHYQSQFKESNQKDPSQRNESTVTNNSGNNSTNEKDESGKGEALEGQSSTSTSASLTAGSKAREEVNETKIEQGSSQSDKTKTSPSGTESHDDSASTQAASHAHTLEPFQQVDGPVDQKKPQGNHSPMSSMDQSHEQINEQHAISGIDPSIVEDTYNGGPVVPTSAVQLNTPLGPLVMGEVSPLGNTFNPTEPQNDEPSSDECFCPKKVCSAKADIGFLVDGSSDIPQIYFAHVLDFIKALARGFNPLDTQVSLVAYGDDAATAFGFSQIKNIQEIDDSIDAVSYMGGDPRTGNALTKVKNGIFKIYSRKDVEHALVLLTSGSSADDTTQAAAELRNDGVKVTAVGLGKLANVKELIDISSEPKSSHVFTAFLDTLPDLMDDIVKAVCSDVKGTLADRTEKCACEAKKDPNQETMHQQSPDSKAGLDSAKLPSNENTPESSFNPNNKAPDHQHGSVNEPSRENPKTDDSKGNTVSTQIDASNNKVDQLGMSLGQGNHPDSQDKQKPTSAKQQSLESDSKAKEANQGAYITMTVQQSPVTDPSQEAHISSNQHPVTESKAKEIDQEANTIPSSQQSPVTDSKAKEVKQEAQPTLTKQQSPATDSKTKEASQEAQATSSNQQSPVTDSKIKEVSQEAQPTSSNQQSPVTDSKTKEASQEAQATSSNQQSPVTDSKIKEANQQAQPTSSNNQSPVTDSKTKEASQEAQPTSSNQQSPVTDSKIKEANQQAQPTSSNKQSPVTDSKTKEASQEAQATSSNQQSPATDSKVNQENIHSSQNTSSIQQSLVTDSKANEKNQGNHISASSEQTLKTDPKAKEVKEESSNSEETSTSQEQSSPHTGNQQSQENSLPTDSKQAPPVPEHNKMESRVPKEDENAKPLKESEKTKNSKEAPKEIPQDGDLSKVSQEISIQNSDSKIESRPKISIKQTSVSNEASSKPQSNLQQSLDKDTKPASLASSGIKDSSNRNEASPILGLKQNSPVKPSNTSSKTAQPEQILVATESSSLPNATKQQPQEPVQSEKNDHRNKPADKHPLQGEHKNQNPDSNKIVSPPGTNLQLIGTTPLHGQNMEDKNQQTDQTQYEQQIIEPPPPIEEQPSIESAQTLNPVQDNSNNVEQEMQQNGVDQQYSELEPGEYEGPQSSQQYLQRAPQQAPQLPDKNPTFKESSQTETEDCSVNLGVVLDSKTTAYGDESNGQKLLRFAKRLTHMFPVSPEGNRVGMMVYSGSPKLKVVHFDHFLDQQTMDKAIDSASFLNMEIKTGRVLNFAQQHLFSRIPSGKQNVLLLITDGVSYDDVTRPALELKRRGVEIFVVGVGRNVVRNELESIATEPADDHVIMTSYEFSNALLEDIKHRICLSSQRKGGACNACQQRSKPLYEMNVLHEEMKRKADIESSMNAYLPRRRGHLYHVLTEIARK